MHRGIILAAMTALAAIASTAAAHANEWCGYTTKDNAVVECGYTSAQNCEAAVDKDGKGGMCFVDPDNALNIQRAAPAIISKPASGRS